MTSLRVSLAPAVPFRAPVSADPIPFLQKCAHVILGASNDSIGLPRPIRPTAASLFAPRGVCAEGECGPLFVSDSGHHRLLVWHRLPNTDGAPADLVIGQPDFGREGRNAGGIIGASTLNVPTGVSAAAGVLAVADAWNHRVLIWHGYPERSNQPANVVLGQADFVSGLANRGQDACAADTLNGCSGVAIADGRLFVADTGNRRVLIWDRLPESNGAPADLVLGQCDFTTRDENAGEGAGAAGMRWPHGVATARGMLFVSDAGNNRVMVWRSIPHLCRQKSGIMVSRPCDFVLGQADFFTTDHNRSMFYTAANAMSMPYGIGICRERLIVADTANSRLLRFDLDDLAGDAPASGLAAQPTFASKGDNRWGAPARDSVCWPYGVSAFGATVIVADSGNNRVLLWDFRR